MSIIETADRLNEIIEQNTGLKDDPWRRGILAAAAELYYCRLLSRADRAVFIGTSENIAVAVDVATWLINTVRLESNRYSTSELERRSFRVSAASAIYKRAKAMIEAEKAQAVEAAAPGTSLMVLRNMLQQANQDWLARKYPNLKMGRTRTISVQADAATAGRSFGNSVNLNRGATVTPESRRLTAR